MSEVPIPSPLVLKGATSYINEDGTVDRLKRIQYESEKAEYDLAMFKWLIEASDEIET